MNSIAKYLLPVLWAVGLWFGTSDANAAMNLSGTAFHATQSTNYACNSYGGPLGGTPSYYYENTCSSWINVVAALPFISPGPSDAKVWVEVYRPNGDQRLYTECTVTSYNYDWTYLGSGSASKNALGNFELEMVLPAAALSEWASLSVQCKVAPGGRILSVLHAYGY